jgi:hypothetical protein
LTLSKKGEKALNVGRLRKKTAGKGREPLGMRRTVLYAATSLAPVKAGKGAALAQHPDFFRSRLSLSQSPCVHRRFDHIKVTFDVKERFPVRYRLFALEFYAAA